VLFHGFPALPGFNSSDVPVDSLYDVRALVVLLFSCQNQHSACKHLSSLANAWHAPLSHAQQEDLKARRADYGQFLTLSAEQTNRGHIVVC